MTDWQPIDSAPMDGTHILACRGQYSETWGFNQSPPMVVHYFPCPSAPGFYLSNGIVSDSYNDEPQGLDWWQPLPAPPATEV